MGARKGAVNRLLGRTETNWVASPFCLTLFHFHINIYAIFTQCHVVSSHALVLSKSMVDIAKTRSTVTVSSGGLTMGPMGHVFGPPGEIMAKKVKELLLKLRTVSIMKR